MDFAWVSSLRTGSCAAQVLASGDLLARAQSNFVRTNSAACQIGNYKCCDGDYVTPWHSWGQDISVGELERDGTVNPGKVQSASGTTDRLSIQTVPWIK
jgi:hypothetical protein